MVDILLGFILIQLTLIPLLLCILVLIKARKPIRRVGDNYNTMNIIDFFKTIERNRRRF
jgi:Na+/pantothenate symporter